MELEEMKHRVPIMVKHAAEDLTWDDFAYTEHGIRDVWQATLSLWSPVRDENLDVEVKITMTKEV